MQRRLELVFRGLEVIAPLDGAVPADRALIPDMLRDVQVEAALHHRLTEWTAQFL